MTALKGLAHYPRLAREQWLPAEAIQRRQWQRFQAVVRHAFTSSPFCRRRFREAGITAPAQGGS